MSNGQGNSDRSARGELRTASRTHVGLRRETNQDFLVVRNVAGRGTLLVVADGMGGHNGGERASRLAVERFVDTIETGTGPDEELLRRALAVANDAVHREAKANPELKEMGTTLVAALLADGGGTVINLGDSRAYVFRNGTLRQVTADHSMVAELVRRGELTEAEAAVHPRRNVLTRAVGIEGNPKPELFTIDLGDGGVLLLCSDGLHGMVEDADIGRILRADWGLEDRCDALIDAALDAGGRDNVTVVLAQAGEGGIGASGPATDPGYVASSPASVDRKGNESERGTKRGGAGWLYLLVALLIGGAIWGALEFDLFTSSVDRVEGPDSLDIDTAGLLLDSSVQLTPSDMVTDSIWSDSLSVPGGDSVRRNLNLRNR